MQTLSPIGQRYAAIAIDPCPRQVSTAFDINGFRSDLLEQQTIGTF